MLRSFRTWEELISAPNPELQHYPDRLLCVCEDQNIWPVSNNYFPDISDRQLQFKEFSEDAEQNAVVSAARYAAPAGSGGPLGSGITPLTAEAGAGRAFQPLPGRSVALWVGSGPGVFSFVSETGPSVPGNGVLDSATSRALRPRLSASPPKLDRFLNFQRLFQG